MHSERNLPSSAILIKISFFFQKTHLCLEKISLWTFWEILVIYSHSTANLLPYMTLKKSRFFFRGPVFLIKPKLWTFWENLLIESHSTANLLPLAVLKNFKISFRKTRLLFLERNPKAERYEEFYFFSRILRQFKHLNNRCWLVYVSSIGIHGVKNCTSLRGSVCYPSFHWDAKY